MSSNTNRNVYVGNLDENVSERVLYDILIQAGRIVDLYIPRDKETDRPRGFAFAEYETEEVAEYAVKLFSGLVTLKNRTLKFAISGKDKPSPNLPKEALSTLNSSCKLHHSDNLEASPHSTRLSATCRFSEEKTGYAPVPHVDMQQSNGNRSHYDHRNYNYRQRVFGSTLDSITHSRSERYDTSYRTRYS